MEQFRRPLGVIIFSGLAILVGIVLMAIAASSPTNSWLWSAVGGWLITLAVLAALAAAAVIAWRLVRRPRTSSDD